MPGILSAAETQKKTDAGVFLQQMETHWQRLIREKDPERRRTMIQEHRKLMSETQSAMGAGPGGQMGMGGQSHGGMMGAHHAHDMQNTMELHSMMLDMMK